MQKPTEEQTARLPKWAQDHISYLNKCIQDAETTIKQLKDQETPSNVFVEDYRMTANGPDTTTHYIQTDWISLKLPKPDFQLNARLKIAEGLIEISASKCLIIRPTYANVMEILPGK